MACSSYQGADVSPLFPPKFQDASTAKQTILDIVHRDPRQFGIEGTRWTLKTIHECCDWLRVATPAGMHVLLERLQVVYKRGRQHVHSPDPDYVEKLAYVDEVINQARASYGQIVALYQDELTFYRQPTLAKAYEEQGHKQPLAELSYSSNTKSRVVATLDVLSGRVLYERRSVLHIDDLIAFYRKVRRGYPDAQRIYVILDNWPVHFHPDLLHALEPQELRWPLRRPPLWPEEPSDRARKHWRQGSLPIQLVQLPTYAPWTNPVEKLWRKLFQEVLHVHRMANQLPQLREMVDKFLAQFANGSDALLKYVGLLKPS